jgi:hypothetical protein
MKQSLLELPPALIPGLEAALPAIGQASPPLLLTVISVIALITSIVAVTLAIIR